MKLLLAVAVSSVAVIGCKAYSTHRDVPIACDVEAKYDLQVVNAFETVGPPDPGWTAADPSLGAVMTGMVRAIPEGPRCGSTAALVLTADNNNDWGSLFGLNNFGPTNAADYEGMSFWARVGENSNTAFTILLDDPNTNNPDMPAVCDLDAGVPPPPPEGSCRNYCNDGGPGTGVTMGNGMIVAGTVTAAPEPDQCGNSYQTVIAVGPYWRLHTIPFSEFFQTPLPNRVPNVALTQSGPLAGTGLRPSRLLNLIIRMPKAMRTELWIDNLGFYRKATATGGDGGVDAP
jgi:hypothetical protein